MKQKSKTYRESAYGEWVETEKAAVLRNHGGLYGGGSESIVMDEEMAVDVRNSKEYDKNGALQSRASNNLQSNNVVRTQYAVRRLTPIECERLQGLPDNYTFLPGDKSCSDSARYKALGNGMAQTVANWLIQRIVEEVNEQDDGDVDEDTDKGI